MQDPSGFSAPPSSPYGSYPQNSAPKANGKAIAAMVLGIVGLCTTWLWGLGVILGIVALILGVVGNKEIKRSGGSQTGAGMAITGIVLGAIAIAVGVLFLILFGFAIAAFGECIKDPDAPGCEDFQDLDESMSEPPRAGAAKDAGVRTRLAAHAAGSLAMHPWRAAPL